MKRDQFLTEIFKIARNIPALNEQKRKYPSFRKGYQIAFHAALRVMNDKTTLDELEEAIRAALERSFKNGIGKIEDVSGARFFVESARYVYGKRKEAPKNPYRLSDRTIKGILESVLWEDPQEFTENPRVPNTTTRKITSTNKTNERQSKKRTK